MRSSKKKIIGMQQSIEKLKKEIKDCEKAVKQNNKSKCSENNLFILDPKEFDESDFCNRAQEESLNQISHNFNDSQPLNDQNCLSMSDTKELDESDFCKAKKEPDCVNAIKKQQENNKFDIEQNIQKKLNKKIQSLKNKDTIKNKDTSSTLAPPREQTLDNLIIKKSLEVDFENRELLKHERNALEYQMEALGLYIDELEETIAIQAELFHQKAHQIIAKNHELEEGNKDLVEKVKMLEKKIKLLTQQKNLYCNLFRIEKTISEKFKSKLSNNKIPTWKHFALRMNLKSYEERIYELEKKLEDYRKMDKTHSQLQKALQLKNTEAAEFSESLNMQTLLNKQNQAVITALKGRNQEQAGIIKTQSNKITELNDNLNEEKNQKEKLFQISEEQKKENENQHIKIINLQKAQKYSDTTTENLLGEYQEEQEEREYIQNIFNLRRYLLLSFQPKNFKTLFMYNFRSNTAYPYNLFINKGEDNKYELTEAYSKHSNLINNQLEQEKTLLNNIFEKQKFYQENQELKNQIKKKKERENRNRKIFFWSTATLGAGSLGFLAYGHEPIRNTLHSGWQKLKSIF